MVTVGRVAAGEVAVGRAWTWDQGHTHTGLGPLEELNGRVEVERKAPLVPADQDLHLGPYSGLTAHKYFQMSESKRHLQCFLVFLNLE